MKLFAVKAYGHYAGGVAVIRAADEEEARQIAAKIRGSDSWNMRYDSPDEVKELSRDDAGVLYLFETGE